MDSVAKWAKGEHYGPILTQTDLYLLNIPLEIHPILRNADNAFHLSFDITSGDVSGFDPGNRDRDISFTQRNQPATLPRVSQLFIITPCSPWCTTVANENGVTLEDICIKLHTDYSRNTVTEAEFNSLPPRMQETIRRYAASNIASQNQSQWGMGYYTPAQPPAQFKRYDWLRDRILFDYLTKEPNDDEYIKRRLGFTAPNVFVMQLTA